MAAAFLTPVSQRHSSPTGPSIPGQSLIKRKLVRALRQTSAGAGDCYCDTDRMSVPVVFTNPESLTTLSDAVNQTVRTLLFASDAGRNRIAYADHHKLIDTGRFFKSSGSFQARVQLNKSIPESYDRFQLALDKLSEQIVRRLLRRSPVYFALTWICSSSPRHF